MYRDNRKYFGKKRVKIFLNEKNNKMKICRKLKSGFFDSLCILISLMLVFLPIEETEVIIQRKI